MKLPEEFEKYIERLKRFSYEKDESIDKELKKLIRQYGKIPKEIIKKYKLDMSLRYLGVEIARGHNYSDLCKKSGINTRTFRNFRNWKSGNRFKNLKLIEDLDNADDPVIPVKKKNDKYALVFYKKIVAYGRTKRELINLSGMTPRAFTAKGKLERSIDIIKI